MFPLLESAPQSKIGNRKSQILILLTDSDIVGANRDKPAIANHEFTMEGNKPFMLPPILGAETSAAEDENDGRLSLQFGELPAFRSVVGELIVGEDGPWNNVRSHMKPPFLLKPSMLKSRSKFRANAAATFRVNAYQI
jgi:hypothetical protein